MLLKPNLVALSRIDMYPVRPRGNLLSRWIYNFRFVISLTYYGLSLNSGNMPGSLYVNLTLSALAEFLGYTICFLCLITGRKVLHAVAMVVGGLGCICSIPILYIENGESSLLYGLSICVTNKLCRDFCVIVCLEWNIHENFVKEYSVFRTRCRHWGWKVCCMWLQRLHISIYSIT